MADRPPCPPSVSPSKDCKCVQKVVNSGSGLFSSFYTNENKRKWSLMDTSLDLQDGSSWSLGLGCSMSSGVTVFSSKEMEEHSSGNRTEVDLELSLAAGSVESDVSRTSLPIKYDVKPRVTSSMMTSGGFQLVDDGSATSRWTFPLLPAVQTTDPLTRFRYLCNAPKSVIPCAGSGSGSAGSASLNSASVPPRPRRTTVKKCRFIGCTRGARGASGFCISHGGGRRCQREGCQKGAEGKTVFCKAHGGGRRCEFLGCTKSAEGTTDYCIGHGGGKRCSHEGCAHAARGKSGLCIRHGGGKRCKREGCTKSAEGVSGLCISHGGGRRCQYPACTKGAQGSTMFCKAHGGGKRCMYLGCTKGAEGSTSFCKGHGGGKRCTFEGGCSKSVHGGTLFCVSHGGGKRCAAEGCTKSARGRTSFCVRHGGGKRCKHEGCGKSAQGRTDFCKAHGGGTRPSVSRPLVPANNVARAQTDLCPSLSQAVQDYQAPVCTINEPNLLSIGLPFYQGRAVEMAGSGGYSLPEGRVHGGGLMAMLKGCTGGPSKP